MDEILNCLIEEVNRCRGLAKIPGIEAFKDDYLHKAEMLEQAAEIVKQVAAIGPHGRLGDLDALTDKVIGKYIGHERKNELIFAAAEIKQDICDLIGDAPTIIPAEEDEP